jgi:hypothetical protein
MSNSKQKMEDGYGVKVVAWCSDNGPDSKKGRRLLSEAYLWMIMLVCWAHQINLVVGDLLGVKHELVKVIEIALEIIRWLNSHGEPLGWLESEQKHTYGKSWSLFLPVITRWLAHYHAISRLLQIEEAVICFWLKKREAIIAKAGNTAEKRDRAERVLEPIGDPDFWKRLRR